MKPGDQRTKTYATVRDQDSETGPDSAGQSGETQGLSNVAVAGGESVQELLEEGQAFEAEAIGGVEDAPMRMWRKFIRGKYRRTMFLWNTWREINRAGPRGTLVLPVTRGPASSDGLTLQDLI
jgi:hypothetical protein